MKINEVSRLTGLSKSTIRFYVKKGLIKPESVEVGSQRMSYTEADVRTLTSIAALRRALFSIEQIRTMLEDPAQIPEVWSEYLQGLKELSDVLSALTHYARRADSESFEDIHDVAKSLEPAARSMPMPNVDRNPRFARFDTEEFAESRETRERNRLQYAQTRYMPVPPSSMTGYEQAGGRLPTLGLLGPRATEFMPRSRLGRRLLTGFCVVSLLVLIVVILYPNFFITESELLERRERYVGWQIEYSDALYDIDNVVTQLPDDSIPIETQPLLFQLLPENEQSFGFRAVVYVSPGGPGVLYLGTSYRSPLGLEKTSYLVCSPAQ